MWITDPHRRIPRLGFFVSSSEEPLHHPEIPSSSSVRPESLLNSFLVDLLVTHCWDNSTTVACVRLLSPYHGLVKYGAVALTCPIWYLGGNMPFIMAWLSFDLHGQWWPRMLCTTLVESPNYPFLWYSSWGMCLSHEVFQELQVDSHRSIFTSVGVFPDLLRTLIRSSSRTVAFSYSAPAEPCHLLHQVSLFFRCLPGYGLTIRPFARPFLDRCTEFSFF